MAGVVATLIFTVALLIVVPAVRATITTAGAVIYRRRWSE